MARPSEAVAEALLALDEVTRRLRRECPWDREQNERSIVPHTVEEAYELADAAHSEDDGKLREELGDVLFQVYFLALLLEERGQGDLATVARGVTEKLIHRHPHVFESEAALAELPTLARTPAQVKQNWDAIKEKEPRGGDPLAGIPETLPALLYARKLQRRAASRDRAAPDDAAARVSGALENIARHNGLRPPDPEESEHPRHGSESLYERIGELLFAAVELSRSLEVDPEVALRRAADRFRIAASGP